MKTRILFLFTVLVAAVSCQKEESVTTTSELGATVVAETLDNLYLSEDISAMAQSTNLVLSSTSKATTSTTTAKDATSLSAHDGAASGTASPTRGHHGGQGEGAHHFDGDEYGTCAVVTIDDTANTKTIDFGDGCTDGRGITRSGQIVITYSDSTDVVGSYSEITFVNFVKDSVGIEGTRRMEIIDIDADGNVTTETTLSGGKLVYSDATYQTKVSDMVRFEYKDATDRSLNYTTLTGTESGVDTDGVAFTMTITTPILFVNNCDTTSSTTSDTTAKGGKGHGNGHGRRGHKIPVQGVKQIVSGTDTIVIDFGDGTCDTLVDVTTNGVTETVDISTLSRDDEFDHLYRMRH